MTARRRHHPLRRRIRRLLRLSAHARQQLARFARLFGAGLAAQLMLLHGPVTRDVAAAAVVAAAEAAWRQYAKVGTLDPPQDPG